MARGDFDFTRDQTLTIFRDAENAALKGHVGLPGSDGTGNLRILCRCPQGGFSVEKWGLHLVAVIAAAREVKQR